MKLKGVVWIAAMFIVHEALFWKTYPYALYGLFSVCVHLKKQSYFCKTAFYQLNWTEYIETTILVQKWHTSPPERSVMNNLSPFGVCISPMTLACNLTRTLLSLLLLLTRVSSSCTTPSCWALYSQTTLTPP